MVKDGAHAAVQQARSRDPEQEGNQGKGDRFWLAETEGGGGGRFGASAELEHEKEGTSGFGREWEGKRWESEK